MLAIEQFLKNNSCKKNYPIPDNCGSFSYSQKNSDGLWTYHFYSFKWENQKTHPSYFIFKYYYTIEKNNNCFITNGTNYIGWQEFFNQINEIRISIRNCKSYKISKNKHEAEDLMWQVFVKTMDKNFATNFKSLPLFFYDSIDDNKTTIQKYDARSKFIEYMQNNINYLYQSWTNLLPYEFTENFSFWFYNYIIDV